MPTQDMLGREVHVDDEGFLTEYDEWDEKLGAELAKNIGKRKRRATPDTPTERGSTEVPAPPWMLELRNAVASIIGWLPTNHAFASACGNSSGRRSWKFI